VFRLGVPTFLSWIGERRRVAYYGCNQNLEVTQAVGTKKRERRVKRERSTAFMGGQKRWHYNGKGGASPSVPVG